MAYRLYINTKDETNEMVSSIPHDLPTVVDTFFQYLQTIGNIADYLPGVVCIEPGGNLNLNRVFMIELDGKVWDVSGFPTRSNRIALQLAKTMPAMLISEVSISKPGEDITPVQMVEESMRLINQAVKLLAEATKGHPVEHSFKLGMLDNLNAITSGSEDPNHGTLPLLIRILTGARVVPASQIDSEVTKH